MFTGFPPETIQFFLDLRYHNSAAFFHGEHDRYVRDVQAPFYAFTEELMPTLLQADPRMETRPHRSLSRIHRDTRFSRDKSPYRDHLWTWYHPAAEPREGSIGFWFELGPQGVGWGLALWGGAKEARGVMDRFRRAAQADPARIGGIITSSGLPERHLALVSEQYKRLEVPPGVTGELARWYRSKDISLMQMAPDMREIHSRDILEHVRADYQALTPIYRLLRGWKDEILIEEAPATFTDGIIGRRQMRDEWE